MVDRSSIIKDLAALAFITRLNKSVLLRCMRFKVRADYAAYAPDLAITVTLWQRGDTEYLYCYRVHLPCDILLRQDATSRKLLELKAFVVVSALEAIWEA